MDVISLYTENKEYLVIISMTPRYFSYNKFGQYECHIRFMNALNIGQCVFDIECTEKQLYDFMNTMNDIDMNIGSIYSARCYFGNNIICDLMSSECLDYPTEDDPYIMLQFYEETFYGRVARIYLKTGFYWLEEFMYDIYLIMEDLPYLAEMGYSSILEFMDENIYH